LGWERSGDEQGFEVSQPILGTSAELACGGHPLLRSEAGQPASKS